MPTTQTVPPLLAGEGVPVAGECAACVQTSHGYCLRAFTCPHSLVVFEEAAPVAGYSEKKLWK